MAAQIALYVNVNTGTLQSSVTNTFPIASTTLPLFAGDKPLIWVYLVNNGSALSTSGITLKMAISNGNYAATDLASQTTWTAGTDSSSNPYFYANLDLSVSNITSLFSGSIQTVSEVLKISATVSSNPQTVFSGSVNIGVGYA